MTAPARPSFGPSDNGIRAMPPDADALRDALLAQGAAWREVDLSAVRDKPGLLDALARALEFPPHFGGNWDALADSLEDLSWLPAPGVALGLEGAASFAQAAPEAWRTALDIFERAASYWRKRGRIFVVFARGMPGPRGAKA